MRMNHLVPNDECEAFRRCISSFLKRRKKRLLEQKNRKASLDAATATATAKSRHALHLPFFLQLCHQATYLTNHGIHILQTLTVKRHSLSLAIDAFLIVSRECIACLASFEKQQEQEQLQQQTETVPQSGNEKTKVLSLSLREVVQEIILHIFTQYIHIRDGFVLLTSGECRHTADADSDRSDLRYYPSKLGSSNQCEDGYTKKFSSKCGYSGYGWDEFFDEEVGVKRRLLDVLLKASRTDDNFGDIDHGDIDHGDIDHGDIDHGDETDNKEKRNNLWEKLLQSNHGSGIELFENAFDSHETAMKELQRKLEQNRTKTIKELQNVLNSFITPSLSSSLTPRGTKHNVQITMVTEDKFERIELKNAKRLLGLESMMIQREGDTFRGTDKRGALPSNNITIHDWKEIMKLPSSLQRILYNDRGYSNNHGDGLGRRSSSRISIRNRQEILGRASNSTAESRLHPKKKKKKLVICDSDDDDDDDDDDANGDHNNKNNITNSKNHTSKINENREGNDPTQNHSSLKVTLKEAFKDNDDDNDTDDNKKNSLSSLHEIKKQLGVNIDQLQQSREGVEEEEIISKKAAFVDEIGCDILQEQVDTVPMNSEATRSSSASVMNKMDTTTSLNNYSTSKTTILDKNRKVPNNPRRTHEYNGHNEFDASHLRMNRSNITMWERNDIFHNQTNQAFCEPTERITIGAKKRKTNTSTNTDDKKNKECANINHEFSKFGMQELEKDNYHNEGEMAMSSDKEEDVVVEKYEKWGDEILQEQGINVNKYPACEPERPPKMIQQLGH